MNTRGVPVAGNVPVPIAPEQPSRRGILRRVIVIIVVLIVIGLIVFGLSGLAADPMTGT
jgi:hypothetical protein